jgi:hypothetical protein
MFIMSHSLSFLVLLILLTQFVSSYLPSYIVYPDIISPCFHCRWHVIQMMSIYESKPFLSFLNWCIFNLVSALSPFLDMGLKGRRMSQFYRVWQFISRTEAITVNLLMSSTSDEWDNLERVFIYMMGKFKLVFFYAYED